MRLDHVLELINSRKSRILLFAQAALPESQFKAFKTLFLDEFGKRGLESELIDLFNESPRHLVTGTERAGIDCAGKGVPR